jgi:RNA recognition motif-containing protein
MKAKKDLFDSDDEDEEEEEEKEDGVEGDDEEENEDNKEDLKEKKTSKKKKEKEKEKQQSSSQNNTINLNENENENEDENEKEKSKPKNIIKTLYGIYISGLPFETTEMELKNIFSKYGQIKKIKLPKYKDTNKNMGICYIYFDNEESAIKSLELDKHRIGKRYMDISLSQSITSHFKENKSIDPYDVPLDCTTAFIKNLSYDMTEKEVDDKFKTCGPINEIRFVYDSQNHKFKGFCYIDFKEHKGLLKALKLNGTLFGGRPLHVDYEQGKPKKGKFTNDSIDYNLLNRKRY